MQGALRANPHLTSNNDLEHFSRGAMVDCEPGLWEDMNLGTRDKLGGTPECVSP